MIKCSHRRDHFLFIMCELLTSKQNSPHELMWNLDTLIKLILIVILYESLLVILKS